MKKTITLLVLFYTQFAYSQGLGIGTNPPHASAELDVNSTTRGMLIPRMTASQRAAIVNPAAGLLVFQTDNFLGSPSSLSGLYIYETNNAIVGWKRIAKAEEINNSGSNTWVVSGANQSSGVTGNVGIGTNTPTTKFHVVGDATIESGTLGINNSFDGIKFKDNAITKNRIQSTGTTFDFNIGTVGGNSTGKLFLETQGSNRMTIDPAGNVGIGTISPDKKLHVNGDILSEGTLQGNAMTSTGTLSVASNSIFGGSLTGGSTASFNGNINSNTSISINDPLAEISLKASGVDKGFMQLSGNDVRLGTYSTNNLGSLFLRTNGANRVEVSASGNTTINGNAVVEGATTLSSTTSINGKLTVNEGLEAIKISGADPAINFWKNATQRAFIWAIENNLFLGTSVAGGKIGLNTETVETSGNIHMGTGKLTHGTTTTNYNLLPVCYGRVAANGNKLGGTPNFTSERYSEGIYFFNCAQITTSSIILVNSSRETTTHLTCTYEYYQDKLWVHITDDSGSHRDSKFNFVIFDP
jgi:hypothetical protein